MKKKPEKDRSERYLLTYSDLMNLLLILFIVLYSMSKTDVQKASEVAQAIRKGFNASSMTSEVNQSPVSGATTSTAISGNSYENNYSDFYDKLIALINQAGMASQVSVTADSSDVVITLKDTALYPSGSADLNPQAYNLMQSIGHLVQQVEYALVMVDGYTDTDPIHNSLFTDNRDLSTARANGVLRVLSSTGIPEEKLVSVGYGETHSVAPNTTASNKALNRRVVLTILKSLNGLTPQQVVQASDLKNLDAAISAASSRTSGASSAASKTSSSSKAASSSKSGSSKTSSKASSSSKTSSSKASSSSKSSSK